MTTKRDVEDAVPYKSYPTSVLSVGVDAHIDLYWEGTEALPYTPSPTSVLSVGAGVPDRP